MKTEYYKQCLLKKDDTKTYTWVLDKYAKEGNWCTIEEFPGLWFIEKVFHHKIEKEMLLIHRDEYRHHRDVTDI